MSSLDSLITAAIKSQKFVIAKEYREHVVMLIDAAKRALGPELVRIQTDKVWKTLWQSTLRHYVVRTGGTEAKLANQALLIGSEQFANTTLIGWTLNLVERAGVLTECEVGWIHDNRDLCVTGMKGEHRIEIIQHRSIDSSVGVVYNRYPVLIYCDGKKITKTQYKKM